MLFKPDTHLIRLFKRWIEQFDIQHARNWARLYKDDPEAAMCEATFWGVLMDCGVRVKPNADLSGEEKRPDFECWQDSQKFYVEVTCITIEKTTRQTGLENADESGGEALAYSPLTRAVFGECVGKAEQCSNQDAPCLLAVGTFHIRASRCCIRKVLLEDLLTGELHHTKGFDPLEGKAIGEPYLTTRLESSSFVKPSSKSAFEYARKSISGLLLGGFGCAPPQVYGLLHPKPARAFNLGLLRRIPFCELRYDIPNASVFVEWSNE